MTIRSVATGGSTTDGHSKRRGSLSPRGRISSMSALRARTNRPAITPEEECGPPEPVSRALSHRVQRPGTAGREPGLSSPAVHQHMAAGSCRRRRWHTAGTCSTDLSALQDDRNARICARAGVALVIMHSVGSPKIAHTHVIYQDAIGELLSFFGRRFLLPKAQACPRGNRSGPRNRFCRAGCG